MHLNATALAGTNPPGSAYHKMERAQRRNRNRRSSVSWKARRHARQAMSKCWGRAHQGTCQCITRTTHTLGKSKSSLETRPQRGRNNKRMPRNKMNALPRVGNGRKCRDTIASLHHASACNRGAFPEDTRQGRCCIDCCRPRPRRQKFPCIALARLRLECPRFRLDTCRAIYKSVCFRSPALSCAVAGRVFVAR